MQDRKDKREQAWQNKDGAGKAHVPGVGYSTIVGSSGCSISCICLLKEAFGSTASPVLAAARSAARCGAVRLNSCRMFLASWVSLCEAQPPLLCSATMPNAAFGGAPRSPPWAALRNTPPFGVWWGRLEGGSARRRGGVREVLANKLAASGKTRRLRHTGISFFADFGGASKAPPHVAPLAERLQRPIYGRSPDMIKSAAQQRDRPRTWI